MNTVCHFLHLFRNNEIVKKEYIVLSILNIVNQTF